MFYRTIRLFGEFAERETMNSELAAQKQKPEVLEAKVEFVMTKKDEMRSDIKAILNLLKTINPWEYLFTLFFFCKIFLF